MCLQATWAWIWLHSSSHLLLKDTSFLPSILSVPPSCIGTKEVGENTDELLARTIYVALSPERSTVIDGSLSSVRRFHCRHLGIGILAKDNFHN